MAQICPVEWTVFLALIFTFGCIVPTSALSPPGPARGGNWCRCPEGKSLYCEYQFLRFRPGHDRSVKATSYIQDGYSFYAVIGRTLPLVIVQIGSSGQPAAAVNSTVPTSWDVNGLSSSVVNTDIDTDAVTLTASVISSAGSSINVTMTPVRAIAGQFYIRDLNLIGLRGMTGYLNFSTNTGLWLTSAKFEMYEMPTQQNIDPLTVLQFQVGAYLYNGRNQGPFDLTSIVITKPLPSFTVQVVDVGGVGVGIENQGTVVATAQYIVDSTSVGFSTAANITVLGGVATIQGFTATFDSLAVAANTLTDLPFRFSFAVEGRPNLRLSSQALRGTATAVSMAMLQLGDPKSSFLNWVSSTSIVSLNSPLPPIRVRLLDTAFNDDDSNTGLIIRASCGEASIRELGSASFVRDGVATFDQLVFTGVPSNVLPDSTSLWPVSLTFTAGLYRAAPVQGYELLGPPINISGRMAGSSTVGVRYRSYDSLIQYEGQSIYVNNGAILPPLVLEVLNERQQRTSTTGDLVLSVVSSPDTVLSDTVTGTKLRQSSAGLVVFDGLRLTIPTAQMDVKLRILDSTGRSVLSESVVHVVNQTMSAVGIRFEPFFSSAITGTQLDGFATKQIAMPPIVLEILDSTGNVDTTAEEVVVQVSSNILLINSLAVSYHGRIVFPNLIFSAAGTTDLRFTVTAANRGSPLVGTTLSTGHFVVLDTVSHAYQLRFHPEGYATYRGQRIRASRGSILPKIGIQVVASDYTVDVGPLLQNLVVEVRSTDGTVLGSGEGKTVAFDPQSGTAWFTDLVFQDKLFTALVFTCRYGSLSSVSNSSLFIPVVGKSIATGEVYFVGAGEPLYLQLLPFDGSGGRLKVNATNHSTPLNRSSDSILFKKGATFQAAFEMVRGDGLSDLPDTASNAIVIASSSDQLLNANRSFQNKGDALIRSLNVTFEALKFSPTSFIDGFFSVLTFTSAWPLLNKFEPTRLGHFIYDAIQTDLDEPVVVAEVSLIGSNFELDLWLAALTDAMRLSPSRVEVVRVRDGSTGSTGSTLTWKGTHVELRFLSPTTATTEKASSAELAAMFLAIDANDCDFTPLRIHAKYYLTDTPTCDTYRLDDQIRAARRCVETSPAAERCKCHEPLFEVVGEMCQSVDQMSLICSELQRCTSSRINDVCFRFELSVYLKYIRIGAGVLGSLLFLLLLFLWRTGFFTRRKRLRLKKKADQEISMKGKFQDEAAAVLV